MSYWKLKSDHPMALVYKNKTCSSILHKTTGKKDQKSLGCLKYNGSRQYGTAHNFPS